MIILIAGASHTGKTVLAQRLLEKYRIPYLSIDLIKMGLIRSENTKLTPDNDKELIGYLWPMIREIVKTAVENHQSLIIEGSYIPFEWRKDFTDQYLNHIQYYCLIMSKEYIQKHFSSIMQHANDIENRMNNSWCTIENLIAENVINLQMCRKYDCNYILIEHDYIIDIEL